MAFLWNAWYVAGWPQEFGDKPVARTILGKPLVFFRRSDGAISGLDDRCPHRHIPLSHGKRIGDIIECAYHGLQFDMSGRCIHVPAQDSIPERARVRNYPVTEKHGWVWVYMGDADRADPATIPDFHWLGDPKFAATGETKHVNCHYELLHDNLLDLSHVGYVHATTIGNNEMGAKGQIRVEKLDKGRKFSSRQIVSIAGRSSSLKHQARSAFMSVVPQREQARQREIASVVWACGSCMP